MLSSRDAGFPSAQLSIRESGNAFGQLLVSRVVSIGGRNTQLEPDLW
jgi:hypothetical protein